MVLISFYLVLCKESYLDKCVLESIQDLNFRLRIQNYPVVHCPVLQIYMHRAVFRKRSVTGERVNHVG